MTPTEREECLRLYSQGVLIKHLAEKYGRHPNVLGRLIRRSGVKRGHKFRASWAASTEKRRMKRRLLDQRRYWRKKHENTVVRSASPSSR